MDQLSAQQLATAGASIDTFISYDGTDAEASELSRRLDDNSLGHRFYYAPYNEEDVAGAGAAWKVGRGGRRAASLGSAARAAV
jgi:hypothetical protein